MHCKTIYVEINNFKKGRWYGKQKEYFKLKTKQVKIKWKMSTLG